jgi:2-dehydro-3-deoxygalactonokinase
LLGLLQDDARTRVICMPGTHCKWVNVVGATIVGFRTYMTGEAFKLFSEQSILSRLMQPNGEADVHNWTAFDEGMARAAQPGHLLHHLFAVRTQGLFDNLEATALKSYLSGILVAHEVMAAQSPQRIDGPVVLVGDGKLTARYERALAWRGLAYQSAPEDIVVRGLTRVARAVGWLVPEATGNQAPAHAATQS